jgi:hypothetical protein
MESYLDKNYIIIREEALMLKAKRPYINVTRSFLVSEEMYQYKDFWISGYISTESWKNFGLFYGSIELHPELQTSQVIRQIESLTGRTVRMAGFTILTPGGILPMHQDNAFRKGTCLYRNVWLYGVDVPENCCYLESEQFDVLVEHKNGKLVTLDDSYLHSTWNNNSIYERMVLVIQFEGCSFPECHFENVDDQQFHKQRNRESMNEDPQEL